MQDILNAVKIVDVYTCLTGCTPKRSGGCYRGKATWRNGDGFNVSLDNDRGVWHDFATDDGGGILDLIVQIRGGSRKDALIWASEFSGIPLQAQEFTPEQRAEWVKAKQDLEQDLPDALFWQRAAVNMAENALIEAKAKLFDPTPPDPQDLSEFVPCDGIYDMERMLSRLRNLDGQRLVEDYRWWRERYPYMTASMIRAAKEQAAEEERTLRRYFRHGS